MKPSDLTAVRAEKKLTMDKVELLSALRLVYLWIAAAFTVSVVVFLARGDQSMAYKFLWPGLVVLFALHVLMAVLDRRRRRVP